MNCARAFGPRTKAIIVNTPNNPTGKVFTREELEFIRDLCVRWNAFAITDEIYEHILYDGARHISMASLEGMRDRAITINGMSKTYSVTGWRVGWAIAPPAPTESIRKVHDFLTVGAAAPLQAAGAFALKLPDSYYQRLAETYRVKRDRMLGILEKAGFECFKPSRRVLHHDRYFAVWISRRRGLCALSGAKESASPWCRARAFTTMPPTAPARSASRFARRKRRWPPPPSAFRACVHPEPPADVLRIRQLQGEKLQWPWSSI